MRWAVFPNTLILVALLSCAALAQKPAPTRPDQLVRRVIAHELQAEAHDHTYWAFRLQEAEPGSGMKTEEIVETPHGWVRRLLAINGRRPNPQEQARDDARLKKLLTDPGEQRKEYEAIHNDEHQAQDLMKLLPDAFLYTYAGRGGDVVRLNFRPNPKFHPSSRKAAVFHDMVGTLWLDVKQQRLAEISGRLNQEVTFAGGLLGHLDKGGTFDAKQREIGSGSWDVVYLDVQMNGKALFFKTINVHEKDIRSDYHRVPGNLSLAQAASLLKKQTKLLAQTR